MSQRGHEIFELAEFFLLNYYYYYYFLLNSELENEDTLLDNYLK